MTDVAKKALVGSGAAVAGIATIGALSYYSVTEKLMRIAMDRETPKFKNLERVKVHLRNIQDSDLFYDKLAASKEALEHSGCQTVEIRSYDGEKLTGHWYPAEGAKRIIIAMHGWRSSWAKDFGLISQFLHDENCSVLYAEQRGQNSSGGDYIGFGLLERYDCLEWAKWITSLNKNGLPVYLAGVSMGATTVLMASGLELPDDVHGIVSDCGFTSPQDIWKYVVTNHLHLSYGVRSSIASSICKKKIQMGAADCSTIEVLEANKIPVLFIHGTEDRFVPIEMTYENYKACNAPKRLFVVPGAGHGMSYSIDEQGYQAAVRDFWHSFD